MLQEPGEVTAQLQKWSAGDPQALEDLLPRVFDELRGIATAYFRHEDPGLILQPTALVNDACMKLLGWKKVRWESRAQFFAFAGKLMRNLLIDDARRRKAERRGGGMPSTSLTGAAGEGGRSEYEIETLLDLNRALQALEEIDPQATRIVELRYFGDLTVAETARALGVSERTVKRDWAAARKFLARQLEEAVELPSA